MALEMAAIMTGHAQVVSSCIGAEFSTGGIQTGQGGRRYGLRPIAWMATRGAGASAGVTGVKGPQTAPLAGERAGRTGHVTSTCHQG